MTGIFNFFGVLFEESSLRRFGNSWLQQMAAKTGKVTKQYIFTVQPPILKGENGGAGFLFVPLACQNILPIARIQTKAELTTLIFVKFKLSCHDIPSNY